MSLSVARCGFEVRRPLGGGLNRTYMTYRTYMFAVLGDARRSD